MYRTELLLRATTPALSLLLIAVTVLQYGVESRAEALVFLSLFLLLQVILPPYAIARRQILAQERYGARRWFVLVLLPAVTVASLIVDWRFAFAGIAALAVFLESYGLAVCGAYFSKSYIVRLVRYGIAKAFLGLAVIAAVLLDTSQNLNIPTIYAAFQASGFIWTKTFFRRTRTANKEREPGLWAYYRGQAQSIEFNLATSLITKAISETGLATLADVTIRVTGILNILLVTHTRVLFVTGRLAELSRLLKVTVAMPLAGCLLLLLGGWLYHANEILAACLVCIGLPVYYVMHNYACGARRILGGKPAPIWVLGIGAIAYLVDHMTLGMVVIGWLLMWSAVDVIHHVATSTSK